MSKTLRDILAAACFNEKEENSMTTYSFEEEGEIWFPSEVFSGQMKFGSATVLGRGADLDYLLYSEDEADAMRWIMSAGFTYTGQEDTYNSGDLSVPMTTFRSRNGIYNLVLVRKAADFMSMRKANNLCVRLKLSNKEDRIIVFDAITQGAL
jgi:hypothetical protein